MSTTVHRVVGARCWSTRVVHTATRRSDLSAQPLEWSESREQAHVPAEQPPSAQDPWLPPADAHPRRPLHPVVPPSQGSQPPRCLRREQPGVLSASNRLTSPPHFREVVRRGRRCGGPLIVVHLLVPSPERADLGALVAPRVGFVVSKAVGAAVTRNLVKRRLRHLARERTALLPRESMVVVRALPGAAAASYDELARELDRCLEACGVEMSSSADLAAQVGLSR